MKLKKYFSFIIASLLAQSTPVWSSSALDCAQLSEKSAEMRSSKQAIARNEAATEQYEISYEGGQLVVFPHVYSPAVFPSTFFYAEQLAISPGQSFLEIGTGTGALAITAALSGANRVVATDISPIAVANAEENVKRYQLTTIEVREGSVFDPIEDAETFDLICWNVPYMHIDKSDLSPIEQALYDPGYQGLTRFFAEAKQYLKPNGKLLFGSSSTHMHQDVLAHLLETYGWSMHIIAEKTVPLPYVEGGAPALNVQFCEAVPKR